MTVGGRRGRRVGRRGKRWRERDGGGRNERVVKRCGSLLVGVVVHSSLNTGSALGPIFASVLSTVTKRRKSPLIDSSRAKCSNWR